MPPQPEANNLGNIIADPVPDDVAYYVLHPKRIQPYFGEDRSQLPREQMAQKQTAARSPPSLLPELRPEHAHLLFVFSLFLSLYISIAFIRDPRGRLLGRQGGGLGGCQMDATSSNPGDWPTLPQIMVQFRAPRSPLL